MTRATTLLVSCFVSAAVLAGSRPDRAGSGEALEAGDRFLADLQRRLLGPPLQPAHEDQRRQRHLAEPRLGLPAEYRRCAGRRRRRGDPQGHAADDQRRAVPHRAGSRLGGRRTHRTRALASRLAGEGRHHHRQPRRGRARRLAVLRVAGLQPRRRSIIKDGTERWHKQICDLDQFYYGSVAPVIIGNHVIAGVSGDDLDIPGYLQSHDPVTGEMQWRWYAVPQKAGDPGSETWPNEAAAKDGGGMTWQPVTYDPDTESALRHDRQSAARHRARQPARGATSSPDRSSRSTRTRARWRGTSSRRRTTRTTGTPRRRRSLFDGEFNGQPRKLIAQAARNGHFFVLDRTNGKALISTEYVKTNWAMGYDAKGQPIPNPAKDPQLDGALVSPNQGGAANWPPPSFSPQTGLFYVNTSRAYSVYYIYDPTREPAGMGWHGSRRLVGGDAAGDRLQDRQDPLDHKWEGGARAGPPEHGGEPDFQRRRLERSRGAERHDGRGALARRAATARSATAPSPTSSTACSTSSSARATRCGAS